ncbi:MAG: T9SS type A sorting domain-containing protein [Bacteroidia bacterium]
MKKLLLLLITLCFTIFVSAQNFNFTNGADDNVADTTYYNPSSGTVDVVGFVKNLTSSSISLDLIREDNKVAFGQSSNFCWGAFCYDEDTDRSQIPTAIGAGTTDTTFKLTLYPNSIGGTATIRMVFRNASDANDTLEHVFTFISDPTLSTEEELATLGYSLSIAGANPVSNIASFAVRTPVGATANLVISDLAGRTIATQPVEQNGKINVSVAHLQAGIYMARLEADGRSLNAIRIVKQ